MKKTLVLCLSLIACTALLAQDASDEEVISAESQQKLDVKSYSFGLHAGMLNYIGDLKGDGTHSYFGVGNWAFGLTAEKKFGTNYGVLVNGIFGNVSKRDIYGSTYANFKSGIAHIDINFMLDGDNGRSVVSPFLSVGLGFLFYSPKADLISQGVPHYFWTDGTYRDVEQGAPGADTASVVLVRDYDYETALDGGMALTLPVWGGVKFKISRQIDIRLAAAYVFTFTDELENIAGGGKDHLFYTTFGVNYNLVGVDRSDKFRTIDFTNLFNADSDNDGIKDKSDLCQDTPPGVQVDEHGCALDADQDGVPDYQDREPATPAGAAVDSFGVTLKMEEQPNSPSMDDLPVERKQFNSNNNPDDPK
ncbi:MAG: thrombospondin type 3 repeat-containing protein [Flavobacteriales bacterium]|nr:thrombospondin type 3 repeat-containing protein [Flavobacteriales bacterium]